MKKLFLAIRHNDLPIVKEIIKKKPELVNCIAKQPPKKDDGQSPLQVAFKTGNFEIAEYLMDCGADVNFMESESCNEWRMPVVQDAIRATVFNARYLVSTHKNGKVVYEIYEYKTKERFETAFRLLRKMFELGANIHSRDSYGTSCLARAILDARQILPTIHYHDPTWVDKRPLNQELKEDLTLVFNLLLELGAEVNEIDERTGETLLDYYKEECVAQFLQKQS